METKTSSGNTNVGIEKTSADASDASSSTAGKLDNASTLDDAHAGGIKV
jgi:hypothetical protein